MKISLDVDIKPFAVPTSVYIEQPPGLRQDGIRKLPEIPLSDLDVATLMKLCDDFRERVFETAGRDDPNKPQERRFTGRGITVC